MSILKVTLSGIFRNNHAAPSITLGSVTISNNSFIVGSTAGTVIGTIQGKTNGSTLTINPTDNRVAISGSNIVVGSTVASAGTFTFTIRETLAGATNTPKDNTISVTVNAIPTTLSTLSLSSSNFTAGVTAGTIIGSILNTSAGSTLSLVDDHSGAVAISGTNLVVGLSAPSSAGTWNITIRETYVGATNSPKDTTLAITVDAAQISTLALDFVDSTGKLPNGVSAASRTGTVAYPIFRKVLRGFTDNTPPVHERGVALFPTITNESANPRMANSTGLTIGSTTNVTVSAGDVIPQVGDQVVNIKAVGHGRSVGDLITFTGVNWGGRSLALSINLVATNSGYYTICNVPDADHFEYVNYLPATANTACSAGTVACVTPTGGTLPQYWDTSMSDSTRKFRCFQQQDSEFGSSPSLGSRRAIDIFGKGTGYIKFQNVSATNGTSININQFIYGVPKMADNMHFANVTLEYAFIMRDSGGNIVGSEYTVNLDSQIGSQIYNPCRAQFTVNHASAASVDVCLKASGTLCSDTRLYMYEHMISKTSYDAPLSLPATIGTSSSSPSRLLDYTDTKVTNSLFLEFDSQAVVNSDYDVIATNGEGLQLRAVGPSFPRDLVLTDGTNSITLAGALKNNYQTQGFNRVIASFSGTSMVLAHNDFNTVSSGTASFNSAKLSNTWRFNRSLADTHEGFIWLKYLELSNKFYTLSEAESACRPTNNLTWSVPNVDFPVGRLGTYNDPPGAMPTTGTTLKLSTTPGTPTLYGNGSVSSTGPGSVLYTASTRLLNFGASLPTTQVIQNMDLRGWQFLGTSASPISAITIRECLIDHSIVSTVPNGIITVRENFSNFIIENCTIDLGNAPRGTIGQAVQQLGGPGFIIRRCKILGVTADFLNLLAGLCEENYISFKAGLLNKHSDATQCNGGTKEDIIVRHNFFDGRNPWGSRCDVNSAMITSTGNGTNQHAFLDEENLILGFTNPTQYRTRPASLHPTGGTSLWAPRYSGGAMVQPLSLTVRNNRYEFATNSGNELDIKMGASISLVNPSGNPFTLGKSGTSTTVMAKIGLETVGTYPITVPSTYIGGALASTTISGLGTQVSSTVPLAGTDLVSSTTSTSHLANMNPSTQYADPLVPGDVFTINGVDFTIVASGGADGSTNINQGDNISKMLSKIQTNTGLTATLVPFVPTVTGNKTLLREKPLSVS